MFQKQDIKNLLLKSREKLFEQEKIWKGICDDLKWKFVPSI